MRESESDMPATGTIRPIRLVRDVEVVRIPRPSGLLDIDAIGEQPDLTTAPAPA
jgi:hypothetical protein